MNTLHLSAARPRTAAPIQSYTPNSWPKPKAAFPHSDKARVPRRHRPLTRPCRDGIATWQKQ
jgi:hypothetical protein